MIRTPLFALAALAAFALAPAARAQTVAELGDAGQTLTTYQDASTVTFTHIDGSLNTAGDADLYRIYISSPATFSATTNNNVTDNGGVNGDLSIDSQLSLFDAAGHAVATNDDASGFIVDSTLPAGNSLYSGLPAGIYFLGIGSSQNEAVNSANQLLFNGYPGGDTTAVRGPASGRNPTTFNNFNSNQYPDTTPGAYEIDLTGVSAAPGSAPEPSQAVALLVGALGLGALTVKARRRAA